MSQWATETDQQDLQVQLGSQKAALNKPSPKETGKKFIKKGKEFWDKCVSFFRRKPKDIPFNIDEAVQKHVKTFKENKKGFIANALDAVNKYLKREAPPPNILNNQITKAAEDIRQPGKDKSQDHSNNIRGNLIETAVTLPKGKKVTPKVQGHEGGE